MGTAKVSFMEIVIMSLRRFYLGTCTLRLRLSRHSYRGYRAWVRNGSISRLDHLPTSSMARAAPSDVFRSGKVLQSYEILLPSGNEQTLSKSSCRSLSPEHKQLMG